MGSRTLVGTGSDGLGEVEPGERKPAADAEDGAAPTTSPPTAMADQATAEPTGQPTASTAPAATTVRPTRPTPGGSALAALLTQNRAKSGRADGRADGGDESGPVPNPTRSTHSSGSFDLLDITAVGDTGGEKKVEAGQAKRPVQARATRLTPATGGLPALLAQTGRESGRSGEGDGKVMAPISTRLTPSVPGFPATVDPPSGRTVAAKKADPADNSDDPKVSEVSGKTGDQSPGVETTTGAGAKDPSAPRPMRLTSGSGGLAALLAQTRSRTGKHETLEKKIPGSASEAGTPRSDSSRPVESAEPAASAASAEPAESGAVISVPQAKSGNFASTLMGVPAPEINLTRPLEVVRQPAPSGRTIKAGSPRTDGDSGSTASEGAGDRARVGSAERFRTTELVNTVDRARKSRIVVGGAVAAAVIVLALVLIPSRKPKPTEQTARAVPGALPAQSSPPVAQPASPVPVTPEQGAAPSPEPTVPSAAGEETAAKDDVQEKARLAAQKAKADAKADALAAKAAKVEEKKQALAEAKAAKAAKAEEKKQALAKAKAAKAEEKKQALAEAKAAKAAKAEEKKQALAEAKAAKAAKAEEKKQALAEAKAAKALKADADKQAPAETKTAKGGKDEEGKEALAAAKVAKADAQKQARAEAKAAKLAKAEAQKQARAEARAAKAAAKGEARAGSDNGVPWDGSSAGSGPGIASRRPASLSETSKSKSSVPARVVDDPDATLPLSTR